MKSKREIVLNILRAIAFAFVVFTSLAIAFASQASSPSYVHGFWTLLPYVCADVFLFAFVCTGKEKIARWLAGIPLTLAVIAFSDLTWRVWH